MPDTNLREEEQRLNLLELINCLYNKVDVARNIIYSLIEARLPVQSLELILEEGANSCRAATISHYASPARGDEYNN